MVTHKVILQPTENGLRRQSGKKRPKLDKELFGDPNDSLGIGGRQGSRVGTPETSTGSGEAETAQPIQETSAPSLTPAEVVKHDIGFIKEALQRLRSRMDEELCSLGVSLQTHRREITAVRCMTQMMGAEHAEMEENVARLEQYVDIATGDAQGSFSGTSATSPAADRTV